MITRLSENVLYQHAVNIFSSLTQSKNSWFHQIRDLCLLYQLPHPLKLLQRPLSKESFKNMVKKHVISYWEQTLRAEASPLISLNHFKPQFMSLKNAHPLWTTAGCSPVKVAMATVQAQMLSGRYRTDYLCRHWSKNKSGCCLLSRICSSVFGDLHHILVSCPALHETREKLMSFTHNLIPTIPHLSGLVLSFCSTEHPQFMQFLLDPSTIPEIIESTQKYGPDTLYHLFHITRTWVYTLHRERMKRLGRWNIL